MNTFKAIVFSTLVAVSVTTNAQELDCLRDDETDRSSFYGWLQRQAYAALDRRQEAYEKLETAQQIVDYQQGLKDFFVRQLGGFPERTPLNSRTVGQIDADGYRIEKVIFDSQPNHSITANFYIPSGAGPFPGVVVSSGHSRTAKTADYNQRFGIMMAKQGMAALCFDPIGQGERSQILNEDGTNQVSGTTTEHFLVGVGSILVGRSTARYRIWDAMRAIDYLVSRKEIDRDRIGMTGCSGGGTLTSYTMALDDRIQCAAPSCYLTTFRHLIATIGPQDAEQNIFAQLAFGMDQPDYVIMRAPRPTLISSTTDDFFSIEGSWDNYRQAKRVYTRLGFPERVDLVEAEGDHGVRPQALATIAHWMGRWLLNRDQPIKAEVLPTRSESELQCTESGQVLNMPGQLSVFDLNAAYETELAARREQLWQSEPNAAVRQRIREMVGVRPNPQIKSPQWQERGRVARDTYDIDKLVLSTDAGVPLPALTFHPRQPRDDDAYLYLHDDGKLGDAMAGGPIERLVSDGFAVVAVDLRGQGETGPEKSDKLLGDWKTYYLGYLLGRSLVGLRVEDTLAAGKFVAGYQRNEDDPRRVHLVGVGQSGIVALHAAALHPELFASVTLRDAPRDWASVVRQSMPSGQLEGTVHGALQLYDLPNLIQLAGKENVRHAATGD